MQDGLIDFLRGATMMADIGVAVFLVSYWKQTQDRLFLFFSAGFVLMAISQIVVFAYSDTAEFGPYSYLIRLLAFILLILGIVEKNLPGKNKKQ